MFGRLAAALTVSLTLSAISYSQTLRPAHQTTLFDAVGRNMGAWMPDGDAGRPGGMLRFELSDGKSVFVALNQEQGGVQGVVGLRWHQLNIYFSGGGCTGIVGSAEARAYVQGDSVNHVVGADNVLYLTTGSYAQITMTSVLSSLTGLCEDQNPTPMIVYTLTSYVDLDTLFTAPFTTQKPPVPLTATFADVPTNHWAFVAVERLKGSRVTAGCTATEFCPGYYVTRAEMAWFLTRALGLVPLP